MMPTDETNSRPKPLPSTFQQVVENMENIKLEILPIIDIIKNTILPNWNPDKPDDKPDNMDVDTDNDIVYDPDTGTMRVIGITVIIEHKDEDLKPDQYLHDVTWELKNAQVIGLKGKAGITLNYVTLRTVRMTRETGVEYPAWQCAFGDENMEMYYRQAKPDNTWGEWVRVIDLKRILEQDPEVFKECLLNLLEVYPDIFKEYLEEIFNRYPDMFSEIINNWVKDNPNVFGDIINSWIKKNPDVFNDIFQNFITDNPDIFQEIINQASHRQILESYTQPADSVQEAGDYWFQPLDGGTSTAEFAMQSVETNAIETLTDEVMESFCTQSTETEGDPESGGEYALETPR